MADILSVLLVEDDPVACEAFVSLFDQNDAFRLVDVTNNSFKAVEIARDCLPDIVILDLELHQGRGTGLLFLRDLKQEVLSKQPYILVTTNNTSTTTYDYVRQMGVDFIMSKHQEDYSVKGAVEFLAMMKDIILDKSRQACLEPMTTPEQRNKRLMQRIASELNLIGVSPKAIGYRYLQEAILLAVQGEKGNLSSKVGQKLGKTTSSVERAMQNAINRAWSATDPEDLLVHYTARISSDRGVPTLTEFIYFYANKLKLEY